MAKPEKVIETRVASYWADIFGQTFDEETTGQASYMAVIMKSLEADPTEYFEDFKAEPLNTGQRLYFAVSSSIDCAAHLLFAETDTRIIEVIKTRMKEERDGNSTICK